jgi:hypothetical protein
MLYYYDIIGLIIFADSSKEYIYKLYEGYILPNPDDKLINDIEQNTDAARDARTKQNLLHSIARNISKSACAWCPKTTKQVYESSLNKSIERFTALKHTKNKVIQVPANSLPIGHFISKTPRFFHPDRGWFYSPEYLTTKSQWVENPIIIGYHVKSKTGIHVRFKLRKPIQYIKIHKDARLIEKGSICSTRSKQSLLKLCKDLQIKVSVNLSITGICREIKARLMYLELIERSKGTSIKFFYSHFEVPGE